MSVVFTRDIFCDAMDGDAPCPQWAAGCGSTNSVADARRCAKSEGWTRRDGKDYCPKHSPGGGR